MKIPKILIEKYHSCSADEERILQVISVMAQPVSITEINQVLQILNWKTSTGIPLSQLMNTKLRTHWVSAGLLICKQSRMHCHSLIAELISRKAVKEQRFKEIYSVVESLFPEDKFIHPRYYSDRYEGLKLARERNIRAAFYLKDDAALLKQLELPQDFALYSLEERDVSYLIQLCTTPFDADFFDLLSDTVKVLVICPILQSQAFELTDQQQYYEILQAIYPQAVKKFPSLKCVLANQLMLRGETDPIEALVGDDNASFPLSLMGLLKFQQGDVGRAINYFEDATKCYKKETHKRNIVLPDLAEIIYLIALLKRGGNKSYQQIKQQITWMLRAPVTHRFETTGRLIQELADIQQGTEHFDKCYWLNSSVDSSRIPFQILFHHLILLWAKGKVKPSAELINFNQLALKNGWLWYAWASEGFINNKEQPTQPKDFVNLSTLFKPDEPWKIALKALREVNSTSDDSKKEDESTTEFRMVWGVYYRNGQCMLFPREQKRNSRGWTKGRPIALQKLYEQLEQYDYLTAQDRQICQSLQAETTRNYAGYPSTTYEFPSNLALKLAIGHPLLFWSNEVGSISDLTPIELKKDEPVLEILQQTQELLIRLKPWVSENTAVSFFKQGKHKLSLVEFNLQQQQIAKILGEKGLKIPKSAKKEVMESISAIAPLLSVHSDIGGAGSTDAKKVKADSRPVFQLEPAGFGLSLACYVQPLGEKGPLFHPGLGANSVFSEIESKSVQTQRLLEVEIENFNQVLTHCPLLAGSTDWEWELEDPEDALETLLQLQELADSVLLTWPKGKKIKLGHAADLKQMHITIKKQKDWFSLQGELKLGDDDVLEMMQLLQLLEQSPGRFLKLGENQFITLTKELRKRLDDLHHYSDDLRFHPLAAQAMESLTDGMQVKQSKPWKDQLNKITSASDLITPIPSTFQAELRDYQQEGFQWLARLAHLGAGACLADDMGLGKTIQALAIIVERAAQGPTLVLAPSSVVLNWQDEAQRFAPTLKVKRFGSGDRKEMLELASHFDLILCSYGLLQTEHKQLASVNWQTIVADEAQAIKNVHAKRSQAAMTLNADFKIITTGTPIENHLGELWSLFQFINPGLLGSLNQFNQRFANPIEANNDRNAQRRLKNLIQPFILRRLKTDVLTELPSRTEITLRVELSPEEIAFYEALRRKAVERLAETDDHPGQKRIKMLAEIMRLRRACCHPQLVMPDSHIQSSKLQAFSEIITEMQNNGHKALVFSQFVDHLKIIKTYLEKQNIVYQYLDGSTPIKQRKIAIDAFQSGIGEVFLISLKAGGVGLNLTAADYVIHMDPWWNPAVEDQASDRAHRIGQQRPVTIYRLVASNTIEEKIVQLHSQKRDLADNLLEGSEMSGKMSVEAMLHLIEDNQ
ncbi:MAG: DEAD/DEAH box helicase [Methylococcales bacterium]